MKSDRISSVDIVEGLKIRFGVEGWLKVGWRLVLGWSKG